MWNLEADKRIACWRDFRKKISLLPLEEALTQTLELWAGAPFVPFNLDIKDVANWPDPWTLIEENRYCDIAKCLGIVYTITLSDHKTDLDIELRVYVDPATGYEYNLAWINQGKYILNMVDREIVNNKQFDKTLKLKHQYKAVDLKLDYYNN